MLKHQFILSFCLNSWEENLLLQIKRYRNKEHLILIQWESDRKTLYLFILISYNFFYKLKRHNSNAKIK